MGNTQTVAFQLPTSNGPVLCDVEGNEWRYLRYPKETLNPRAHRGDNHGHHSDLCWWCLDRPEESGRYMVDAEYGLSCVHNHIQLCGNGAVRGDGVWYVAAQYEGTALTYVAALVSELPHTTHHKSSRYVRFRLSDLIAVRGELGHPPVETAAFDEQVADHIQLGNRIIDYYTWLGGQECDEEHLAHPNRSARYRARAEQTRRTEKALREGGYDLDKIREGWQDFRAGRFGFPEGVLVAGNAGVVVVGHGRVDSACALKIGRWAEENAGGHAPGVEADQEAISKLLAWQPPRRGS